jgi:hypothetical protein
MWLRVFSGNRVLAAWGFPMLKHFPGRVELAVFAVLALICSSLVHVYGEKEAGLSILAFPVFVGCAMLGLWKSGRLRATDD